MVSRYDPGDDLRSRLRRPLRIRTMAPGTFTSPVSDREPLPLHLLRRTPVGRPGTAGEDPDLESFLATSSGRRLCCRACRNLVASDGDRIDVEGRHVHRRINPAGFEFEFGCFDEARGAAKVGEPTAAHSWFMGYAWVYSICRRCGAHLGWFFDGRDPRFHGLILDRLEVEEEAPP